VEWLASSCAVILFRGAFEMCVDYSGLFRFCSISIVRKTLGGKYGDERERLCVTGGTLDEHL
jgi:hypothetical protein